MRKSVVNPSYRTYPMYSESNKIMINWWAISRNKKYIYSRVQLDFHILISVPSIMHFQCCIPREIQNILNDLFFWQIYHVCNTAWTKSKRLNHISTCWNLLKYIDFGPFVPENDYSIGHAILFWKQRLIWNRVYIPCKMLLNGESLIHKAFSINELRGKL